MYGISNSQQQGGGGGGAASYKAIKSTLTPSDWQEVAKQPYFVGENAMTWAVSAGTGMPTKSQPTNIGLVAGNSYTITVDADNVIYTKTSEAVGGAGGAVMIEFTMSNAYVYVYDKFDVATMSPTAEGSFCAVETTATNFVITNFEGGGFGTTIQATISDSAIKVNSAVTMYTNTREKISVGTKTNGSVTLIAPSIPTSDLIPYSLEIVGTDTEGLFEIINGYVPDITLPTVPQWHTIYEDATGTGVDRIDLTTPLKGGDLYRITINGEFYIFCPDEDGKNAIQDIGIVYEALHGGNSSLTHTTIGLTHTKTRLTLSYAAQYNITDAGISNYVFSSASELKFTKLEVYR